MAKTRIVLPYGAGSGGALRALLTEHAAEVIAVIVDCGGSGDGRELEAVRDSALADGALRAHVLDAREEFAREYLLPALRAHALPADVTAAGALARALIARKLADMAVMEGAAAVANPGGYGPLVRALAPALLLVPVPGAADRARHAATRSGAAEAATIEVEFDQGTPTKLNGVAMPLAELTGNFATIAAAHGVADAPHALEAAHRQLQRRVADAELDAFLDVIAARYAGLIADGGWFTPLRGALDAFIESVQARITGVVPVRMAGGTLTLE